MFDFFLETVQTMRIRLAAKITVPTNGLYIYTLCQSDHLDLQSRLQLRPKRYNC